PDQANRVHILNMNAVLEAEAGELHADQVGHGCDQDPFHRAGGLGEVGDRLEVLGADLLADEDQVDGGTGTGRGGVDQHVDTSNVAIAETETRHGLSNPLKVLAVDGDINVPRKSGGERTD